MSSEQEVLEQLGLTRNEASLYLLLLELGPSVAGVLIKKSGFQSSVVYHLLGRLQEKGIVSFVKQGSQKYYSCFDPDHFAGLLTEREQELENVRQNFESLLPQLRKKKKSHIAKNVVQVYQGKQGMKSAFNGILNSSHFLVYGGTGNFTPLLPSYQQFFQNERIRRKILQRSILFGEKSWRDGKYETTQLLSEENNLPFSFIVYDDTVLINLFDTKPVTTIEVESKTLAKAFTEFFESRWQTE